MDDRKPCYKREVNYYETDRMGIVHHSNYIRYFEEARIFMLREKGLDYAAVEERSQEGDLCGDTVISCIRRLTSD